MVKFPNLVPGILNIKNQHPTTARQSSSKLSSFNEVLKTRARLPNTANVKYNGGHMENSMIISTYKP